MPVSASVLYMAALPQADRAALDQASQEGLLDVCRRAVAAARRQGRPVLASWAMPLPHTDPLALWRRVRRTVDRSLLWQSAWEGGFLIAAGTAHDLTAGGEDRIASVRADWERLAAAPVTGGGPNSALPAGQGPLLVGGFSFAPTPAGAPPAALPDALMWVPVVQIRGGAGVRPVRDRAAPCELRLNAVVREDSDPVQVAKDAVHLAEECLLPAPAPGQDDGAGHSGPRRQLELPAADDWKDLVRRAVDRIREGGFEKVVLAREVRVAAEGPFDVPTAVGRLRDAYPDATLFAVQDGENTFVGATPEYLVRLAGRRVHTLGLAGTAPRGATPEQDAALAAGLTRDAKIRHEHDVVVRMLREALTDACEDLTVAPSPTVLRLPNVQHLSTAVDGTLAETSPGILRFAERLHPTPALGGHPRAAALDWLARHEGLDRGWYAGLVGWCDTAGQGEFAVAIRSALARGDSVSLYAGCGIVADSDPEAEYAESCAKLRPTLHAFGIE